MSRKIKNKDLIENLKEMRKRLGRVPKKSDLQISKGSKYGASSYRRAFGNITNALIASDLKPNQMRGISDEAILKDIKEIYISLGRTPEYREYKELSNIGYSFPTISAKFGSWTEALIAADVPIIKAGKVSRSLILSELKKWYIKNGCDPTNLSYWTIRKAKAENKFPFSCSTIKSHFDMEWENIMQQIDFRYETNDPFIKKYSYIGKDGVKYLSLLELKTANHLYFLKNNNLISKYKYEVTVCSEKSWTCDFVIELNNKIIWLEIDGMRNNRKNSYNSGSNEKINYYKDNGFDYKIISYNSKNLTNSINAALGINCKYNVGNKVFDLSIVPDSKVFFTREEIYNYHKDHGKDAVFMDLAIPFYEYLMDYININQWIFPEFTESLDDVMNKLNKSEGSLNSSSRIGTQFLKAHFKSYWYASVNKAKIPPVDIIKNKKIMMPLIKYRFGISNSKLYKYKFLDKVIEFNELFDISLKQMRKSLEVNRYVISLFKPEMAKYIYKTYGFEGMSAWDPCAGFGGRLLGFANSFKNGIYIGNEPNPSTFKELKSLADQLDINVSLSKNPVEDALAPKVDLVFTCPPYDFKEHYCNEASQSDVKYKTYDDWVNGFLSSLMKKSYSALKKGGRCIIVFDKRNAENCVKIAENIGFCLENTLYISNTKTHLNPSSNKEKILIFSR